MEFLRLFQLAVTGRVVLLGSFVTPEGHVTLVQEAFLCVRCTPEGSSPLQETCVLTIVLGSRPCPGFLSPETLSPSLLAWGLFQDITQLPQIQDILITPAE